MVESVGKLRLIKTWFDKHFKMVNEGLNKFYTEAPVIFSKFKCEHILPLGDERVRLIILSVLSIPIWKISNYRSANSALLRYRNLALTFAALGIILSPEIFNPFLHQYNVPRVQLPVRSAASTGK